MRLFVLGTSSKGNSTFIQLGKKKFLFDVGFSYKQIVERLASNGEQIENIDGIFITHEHQDHTKGLPVLLKKHNFPLYISKKSYYKIKDRISEDCKVIFIEHLKLIKEEDFVITPFYLIHDSVSNCGFFIRDRRGTLLLIYDTGEIPYKIINDISTLDALIIETNYDVEMLMGSKYPWHLKQRIMSPRGHLSNEQAVDLFNNLIEKKVGLRYVIPVHASEENNHPHLIKKLFPNKLLKENNIKFIETYPEKVSEVVEI